MSDYLCRLQHRRTIAEGTLEIGLSCDTSYHYRAGQYTDITLIKPPFHDSNGPSRTFSFVRAPDQGDEIVFVMRVGSSAFKKSIAAMPLGSHLNLSQATGYFAFHDDVRLPAICLAGGVGIAPFMSLIAEQRAKAHQLPIYLFYANTHRVRAVYYAELVEWAKENQFFTFIPLFTRESFDEKATRISIPFISNYYSTPLQAIYYISGSESFIGLVTETLLAGGIGEDTIKTESFGDDANL